MNNYIDLSKLEISPSSDINLVIALNNTGDVIKAKQENAYSKEEMNGILENYVTADEINEELELYPTKEELNETLSNYITDDELLVQDFITPSELETTLSSKQYATRTEIPSPQTVGTSVNANNKRYIYKGTGDTDVVSGLYVNYWENVVDLMVKKWGSNLPAQHHLSAATSTSAGVMTKEMFNKLSNIPSDAVSETELSTTLNDYALKSDIPQDVNLSNYYTKQEINENYQPKGEYITETELTNKGYATRTEIPSPQTVGTSVNANNKQYIYKGTGNTDVVSGLYMNYWENVVDLMIKKWGSDDTVKHSINAATSTSAGVMTKEMFNKLSNTPSIVSLTQTEYNALSSKDNNTLYLIIG